MRKIKVFVFTPNDKDRDFIISAISNRDDLQIIGIENDIAAAIIKSEQSKPDILIMDMAEFVPIIRRRAPSTSIILISDNDENYYVQKELAAGISGFMLKKTDMDKLLPVIQIVALGGYYYNSSIIKRMLNAAQNNADKL
jgi:DNA-binding NarL/FixJ family response regulator